MYTPSKPLKTAEINQLPEPVRYRVNELKRRWRTRAVSYRVVTDGVYLGEDCDYTFFNANGKSMQINMDGEWSGYSNHPVKSAITKNAPLPEGCWCIEFELFCGHPFIKILHNPPANQGLLK